LAIPGLPDELTDLLFTLLILQADLFDDEYDYGALFSRLWAEADRPSAFAAVCALISGQDSVAIAFLPLFNEIFLNNSLDATQIFTLLRSLSRRTVVSSDLLQYFDFAFEHLADPDFQSDSIDFFTELVSNSMIADRLLAESRFLDFLTDFEGALDMVFLLWVNLAKSAHETLISALYRRDSLGILDRAIRAAFESDFKLGLQICQSLTNSPTGLEFLVTSGILGAILEAKGAVGFKKWAVGFRILCKTICEASEDFLNGVDVKDVIDNLTLLLPTADAEGKHLFLTTFQTIRRAVEASGGDDGGLATAELCDALEGLVDDPGVGPIATYVLNQITGEE
jgi:hypothetical protein